MTCIGIWKSIRNNANQCTYHANLFCSLLQVPVWKRLLIWEIAWNWQHQSLISILTFWDHLLEVIQFLEVLTVYDIDDMSIFLKYRNGFTFFPNFHLLFSCILYLKWKARIGMLMGLKDLGHPFSYIFFPFRGDAQVVYCLQGYTLVHVIVQCQTDLAVIFLIDYLALFSFSTVPSWRTVYLSIIEGNIIIVRCLFSGLFVLLLYLTRQISFVRKSEKYLLTLSFYHNIC